MKVTSGGLAKESEAEKHLAKWQYSGLLKRGGKVFTAIVPNARTKTLLPIIQEKIKPHSIVYTNSVKAYNALEVSDFPHMRLNHSELFDDRRNHINGI